MNERREIPLTLQRRQWDWGRLCMNELDLFGRCPLHVRSQLGQKAGVEAGVT